MQVFLPPEGLTNFGEASSTQDNVFCAQLQRFQIKSMNERGLHSWHAENCYKKFPFLCKRSMFLFPFNSIYLVSVICVFDFIFAVFPSQGKHVWI